jgi:serine/threonine-protein kinase
MSQGRTAEACPKFEESHRLDPSGGTILNLALCHEQQGLLARSWSEFHEAIAFAGRDGRSDREQVAEKYIRGLEPRLSRLTIVVPENVRVDGLRIERDGRELGEVSWSIAMPVDGGEHIVRASAPGKMPFTTTFVVGAESDARTVDVPPLAAAPLTPPVASIASAPAVSLLAPTSVPATVDHARGGIRRRRIAWVVGAAGLIQWGAAGYFGLQAFREHAESNSGCPNDQCTSSGVDLNIQSGQAADKSTVLALTGLVTLATSVYLFWTSAR